MFWTVPPSKSRILGLKTQILEPGKKNIIVGLRLFPMRFDFELQICVFSISKTNDPAYAVQICKIRPEFFRFENPMTQVVGFWPKIRRPGSSDFQIEKWHAL